MSSQVTSESGSVTVVVIGAGHSGLAISACLTELSIDHVLLDRGEIANAWRTERWDSLRLLTPNWQLRLPGYQYDGTDPDGFMHVSELATVLEHYADSIQAPVRTSTTVRSVTRTAAGYLVATDRGEWRSQCVVLANGICNRPLIPAIANHLPASIKSLPAQEYRNPGQLDSGEVLVVGASASGLQLADEIQASGRQVTLAVGEHVRMPRRYRGRDIHWWLDAVGILDQRIEHEADIIRAQSIRSPQLIGSLTGRTLDLNSVQDAGVEIVGKLAAIRDQKMFFSGSLRNCCALADLKLGRLLDSIDEWITSSDTPAEVGSPIRFEPTRLPESLNLGINLREREIRTVIWATGYKSDYSWLNLPVVDKKGKLIHERGVVGTPHSDTPGLYAMGLSHMRRRKSSFLYGASSDARDIAKEIGQFLDGNFNQATAKPAQSGITNNFYNKQLNQRLAG